MSQVLWSDQLIGLPFRVFRVFRGSLALGNRPSNKLRCMLLVDLAEVCTALHSLRSMRSLRLNPFPDDASIAQSEPLKSDAKGNRSCDLLNFGFGETSESPNQA